MRKIKLPSGIEITFEPDRHRYFRDGRQLMGVTKISDMTDEQGWRIGWAAKMARLKAEEKLLGVSKGTEAIDEINYLELAKEIGNAHKETSGTAISIGKAAHGWLETYLNYRMGKGKKPTLPLSDLVMASVTPFVEWADPISNPEKTNNPTLKFLSSEEIVYYEGDGFDYGGTLDLRFELNGKHCIGDFKTGKQLKRGQVWQMALYALAVEQCFDRKVDKLYVFKLPKRDKPEDELTDYKMREVPFTDEFRQRAPMLAAIKSMNFQIDQSLK